MPTREQTIADAIQLFEGFDNTTRNDLTRAWLGVYRILLWFEPVNWVGFDQLPHIIDADKLRPSTLAKKRSWGKPNAWQRRGQNISLYIARQLNVSVDDLPQNTDLLMKQTDYEGLQRQNILGTAFVGLIRYILEKFGSRDITFENEVEAARVFPGITFPGRSGTPRIDMVVNHNEIPRIIISAKWSLRHDRLSDLTNECPIYKASYERIYRLAQRTSLLYYVITNEYDPARLNKILDDSCVDGVVHVHKSAVTDVCGLDGRLDRLIDLVEFANTTYSW
jgi:hypothetical protein